MVSRYQETSFMFRGKRFVVAMLSHNIKLTWVGRKQRILSKAEY